MKLSKVLISYCLVLFLFGCQPTKNIAIKEVNSSSAKATMKIQNSKILKKSFTGFSLYDPEKKKMLEGLLEDMYFTPASTTKILTCYTALKVLGDSLPAIRYVIEDNRLIFWGTGDPSLLNSKLEDNAKVIDFLKSRKEKLYYAPQSVDARFGAGWAWDDYNYSFMLEKNDFPLYGNRTNWKFKRGRKKPTCKPSYFNSLVEEEKKHRNGSIVRAEHDNIFMFGNSNSLSTKSRSLPMKTSALLTQKLLSDLLKRPIHLYNYSKKLNKRRDIKTIYSTSLDDVLREMMQLSDNFLAEQLLLMASYELFDVFDTKKIIAHAKKKFFKKSPDPLVWRDGSGISRYNLFTPRSLVFLLDNMRIEYGEARLLKVFPAGGESGTIKKWYKSDTKTPYVYAKTGTLSNKHCLSGYIKTKSGKTLVFSFMHNHHITSSSPLKKEMTKILEIIRDKY